MSTARIPIPYEEVTAFCRKWGIKEFAHFGSVLRDDFRPESDVDVLVTLAPDTAWTLASWLAIRDELSEILGRQVDLIEKGAIEESRNPFLKRHILSHTEPIYVA